MLLLCPLCGMWFSLHMLISLRYVQLFPSVGRPCQETHARAPKAVRSPVAR
jgi:hypothetical protein